MGKLAKRIRNDTVQLLHFERKLADLSMKAYRAYAPIASDAVLPSLVASITDPLPPDVNALVMTQEQWDAILDQTFMPGVEELMAQRILDRLEAEEVDPEEIAKQATAGINAVVTPVTAGAAGTKVLSTVYQLPSVRDWQAQYLSQVRNRMVNTPNTLFREIADQVDANLAKGAGIRDLRKEIEKLLSVKGQTWKGRAETVARTEATGAFNAATLSAAQVQQEVFGVKLQKVWVSTMDSRTRKTHFAADGQRRDLDDLFRVGRSQMKHPGDPRGSAKETINCRCTTIELAEDEEIPGEEDRQTERNTTDATVRNRVGGRVGDIQGEVDRRQQEEGITRARDDEDGEGFVASGANQERSMKRTWTGTLAPIGTPTGDNRIILSDAEITFRDFPQPLSWQKVSSEGHLQSVVIGGILQAQSDGKTITANGFFLETPEAEEAINLLEEKLIRPSIDPSNVVWEMVDEDQNPVTYEQLEEAYMAGEEIRILDGFAAMAVMGATLVDHPAFAEAIIEVDPEGTEDDAEVDENGDPIESDDSEDTTKPTEEEVQKGEAALVASLAEVKATRRGFYCNDPSVFEEPDLGDAELGLHITDSGRIQGYLALWGVCHTGSAPGDCQTAPHNDNGYSGFHNSEIQTPDGPLAVGRLTVGEGHFDIYGSYVGALEHYDNVATTFAFARVGENAHGIWVSGIAHPQANALAISEGLSAPLSGDWRRRGGKLDLIAALAVNMPGFPTVRGYRNDDGQEYALVAAGALMPEARKPKKDRKSGMSMEEMVSLAASRAAKEAVQLHITTEAQRARVTARATKLRSARIEKANALAARLKERV